jgi:hypothetical protein
MEGDRATPQGESRCRQQGMPGAGVVFLAQAEGAGTWRATVRAGSRVVVAPWWHPADAHRS